MNDHDTARTTVALLTAYMNGYDDEVKAIHASLKPGDHEWCLIFALGLADSAYRIIADLTGVPIDKLLVGVGRGVEAVATAGDGS